MILNSIGIRIKIHTGIIIRNDGPGQLNLFNEIELEGDPKKKEKDPIQLSRNKVKVRQPKTKREVITHGLPEEEVILDIPEKEANCVQCGAKLKAIGKKVIRETLQYIPASLKIIRYVQVKSMKSFSNYTRSQCILWFNRLINFFATVSFEFYLFHSIILNRISPLLLINNSLFRYLAHLALAALITIIFSIGFQCIFKKSLDKVSALHSIK